MSYKPNQYTGLPDYYESGGSGFVPYTGAIADVDLNTFNLALGDTLTFRLWEETLDTTQAGYLKYSPSQTADPYIGIIDPSDPTGNYTLLGFKSGVGSYIQYGGNNSALRVEEYGGALGNILAYTIDGAVIRSTSYTSVGAPTTASNSWLQIYGTADPFISCYDNTGANVVDVKSNGEIWVNDVTTFQGAVGLAPFGPYGSSTEGGLYEFISNQIIAAYDTDSNYFLYGAGALQLNTAGGYFYCRMGVININASLPSFELYNAFGQTANSFQLKNSSSATLFSIGADGALMFDASLTVNALGELGRNANDLQFYDGTAARNVVNKVRKNSAGTVFSRSQLNFIEGANVTLTVADDAGSGEVDITIAATGGGGSAISGTATATVAANSFEHTETLAAVGITSGMKVIISLAPTDDTDENEPELLSIEAMSGEAGTDQVIVTLSFAEATSGAIKLNYLGV
jgi:hypothetical protein